MKGRPHTVPWKEHIFKRTQNHIMRMRIRWCENSEIYIFKIRKEHFEKLEQCELMGDYPLGTFHSSSINLLSMHCISSYPMNRLRI